MNTADLIVKILEQAGVRHIFGIPGGAIEDLNTALYKNSKITPIVTKHEEGAAFMADGYARVSGRLGVCCSTTGPGASNLITGLATAHADSVPVLALTGQEANSVFGKGAFQESGADGVNIVNIFRNFTKYSGMLINENRAQGMVQKALRVAYSGRSGPAHLSLPVDIMKKSAPAFVPRCPRPETRTFDRAKVKRAAELLCQAKRPVILAGWGVVLSRGARELRELAELLNIPVATSPKGKGVFPESHPLSLGVLGFAGMPAAKRYIIEGEVDVLLAVGTSFNEMMTSGWDERLRPTEHLIQLDVDDEEIGKNYFVSTPLVGDARTVLNELGFAAKRCAGAAKEVKLLRGTDPPAEVLELKAQQEEVVERDMGRGGREDVFYSPRALMADIQKSFPANTIFFSEIGTTMAWSIRHMVIDNPYSFFVSLGFGGMGYGTAAPVGAKVAFPDRPIVSIAGDGGFLMNGMEVATAVNYDIPVVWIILNNAMLGMIYHGRRLFRNPVPEGIPSCFRRVDFAMVAEGLGARGLRIDQPGQITPQLIQEVLDSGRPTVLDVWIDAEEVPPLHNRIETLDKGSAS